MDTVPTSVIECALLDGAPPQLGDGRAWCDAHNKCDHCVQDVVDAAREEIRHLKAERDRALAELDKALGEREDAMLSERNAAYNAGFDEGFASADDWYAEHAEELAERGWIHLPVDADGEPIRFGDEVEWQRTCSEDYSVTEHGTVDGLEIYEVNGEIFAHITINRNGYNNRMPSSALRHHHAPTVEDVLREMADRCYADEDEPRDRDAIVAEFAAKLRLADE